MRIAHFAPFQKFLGITDEQLMWRAAMQDDEAAFTSLMCRWQPPILRLCLRMLGDRHRAEDLAQETFTRVFTQRKKYQRRSKFSTWLWRIALNLCYDALRAPERREAACSEPEDEMGDLTLVSSGPVPDDDAVRAEEDQLVRQALASLPETYRTILILRHYEDLKFREIAEILGIPQGTVKSRMAEALSQLSRRLDVTLENSSAGRPKTAVRPNQKAFL
jgi:RNA polymerase sigma-70 factor, ECF subfamily